MFSLIQHFLFRNQDESNDYGDPKDNISNPKKLYEDFTLEQLKDVSFIVNQKNKLEYEFWKMNVRKTKTVKHFIEYLQKDDGHNLNEEQVNNILLNCLCDNGLEIKHIPENMLTKELCLTALDENVYQNNKKNDEITKYIPFRLLEKVYLLRKRKSQLEDPYCYCPGW
jgi:hypothetical protein